MNTNKVTLPFDIIVTVENGGGSVSSCLHDEGYLWCKGEGKLMKAQGNGFADGLESLLLALACAGVDIHTPAFAEAIQTAVDAAANNY
jgi:hypothetical protein